MFDSPVQKAGENKKETSRPYFSINNKLLCQAINTPVINLFYYAYFLRHEYNLYYLYSTVPGPNNEVFLEI